MAKSCIIVLALCLLQFACGGVVRRDAPADTTNSPITEFSVVAQETLDTLHKGFLEFFQVKSNDELADLVRVEARKYATKLQDLGADLTKEAQKYSGDFDDALNSVKAKISETVSDIESKNPELVADSKKYREAFETNLKTIIAETQSLSEKLKKEGGEMTNNFQKVTQDLYQTSVQTASALSQQVENAVKEHKAKV
uniref:Uncharacterized protein n=1 Tax=Phlebotomus papatasi TaxID=29031 RepID=A0A1B0DQ04_PHLPP